MKFIKSAVLFLIMMTLLASSAAWAGRGYHHGHSRVGVHIGVPLVFGAGWYGAPSYYPGPSLYYPAPLYYGAYPQAYVQSPQPLTYVERPPQQQAGQDRDGYWYYCSNPQGYYPNVPQCASGWQRVAPQR